jgi:hypothetical protein
MISTKTGTKMPTIILTRLDELPDEEVVGEFV